MLSHLKYLNGEQSETTVGVFHQWCLLAAHKTHAAEWDMDD